MAYRYRSRYSEEEVSEQNNLKSSTSTSSSRSLWGAALLVAKWTCSTRRRLAVSFVVLLLLSLLTRNAGSVFHFINIHSTHMSSVHSHGYIHEPKWKWKQRKQFLESVRAQQTTNDPLPPTPLDIPRWYETHWHSDFKCPSIERIVGGNDPIVDAGKWYVCNPRQLAKQKKCLVYTSVRPNGLVFEHQLLETLASGAGRRKSNTGTDGNHNDNDNDTIIHSNCEVHVFDPTASDELIQNYTNSSSSIHIHKWGFGASKGGKHHLLFGGKKSSADTANVPTSTSVALKSIPETIASLGHKGRTIDLMVLDCAGCEWATYPDWFHNDVTQILVQVHGAPSQTNSLFQQLQSHNYVTFHKQASVWNQLVGQSQFYSFLKIRKQFFAKSNRLRK